MERINRINGHVMAERNTSKDWVGNTTTKNRVT